VVLDELSIPIVLAPLAGGASTPQLTAAVSNAGGLGFTPAGYLTAIALAERIAEIRKLTSAPVGVNAPAAYPEVHHLTAPLRAAGRASRDAGLVNLWAGQSHQLGGELPAGELARALADQARAACQQAARRLGPAGGAS